MLEEVPGTLAPVGVMAGSLGPGLTFRCHSLAIFDIQLVYNCFPLKYLSLLIFKDFFCISIE